MLNYSYLLDRLPDPGELHRALSEVFAVDPAGVYVGRLHQDVGGPPATVYCGYTETEGGEFLWLVEIGAGNTVNGPTEPEVAAALCSRFGVRALLSLDEHSDEWWRLITADDDRRVALDLDELDEDRYVLVNSGQQG